MRKSRFSIVWAAIILMLAVTAPAHADRAVPTILLVWPSSWILLLLIIPVEAIMARRIIGNEWKDSFKLSVFVNVLSTLVGIPLTWLLLAIGILITAGVTQHALGAKGIEAVVSQTVLIMPYYVWRVYAALALLCIPFFFMSVWTERWIARKYVPSQDRAKANRWAWYANMVSYVPIILVLTVIAILNMR